MRYELSPSMLSADILNLDDTLSKLKNNNIKYLHIDVMDGRFVPNITYGIPYVKSLKKSKYDFIFDTHLMIIEPENYIEKFADAGADIITFHFEATKDHKRCIDMIHNKNKKAGMAINPETDVDKIIPFIDDLDLILIMGVHPGFSGQKYIEGTENKLKKIYEILKDKAYNDKILEVDGGVDDTNIKLVSESGANLIVSGSFIFSGDIQNNIKKLYE